MALAKAKKINARVDFTPMVDMMMLLITFFMLCTTLARPKSMEINMPSNKEDLKEEQQNKVKASDAITLLLDKDDKIYYYQGIPEIDNLKETTYGENGLRKMLAQKNINAIQRVKQLRKKYAAMVTSNVQKEEQQKKEFEKELGRHA